MASYHVGTPDPYLSYPPIGQRLIIVWTLPNSHLNFSDLHLKITVRFRNQKETVLEYPVVMAKGTFVYSVKNADYVETGGMLTYKVELMGDGQVIDEWRHQIWENFIRVGEECTSHENQEACTPAQPIKSAEEQEEEEFCKSIP